MSGRYPYDDVRLDPHVRRRQTRRSTSPSSTRPSVTPTTGSTWTAGFQAVDREALRACPTGDIGAALQDRRHDAHLDGRRGQRAAVRHVLPAARHRHSPARRPWRSTDWSPALDAGVDGVQRLAARPSSATRPCSTRWCPAVDALARPPRPDDPAAGRPRRLAASAPSRGCTRPSRSWPARAARATSASAAPATRIRARRAPRPASKSAARRVRAPDQRVPALGRQISTERHTWPST